MKKQRSWSGLIGLVMLLAGAKLFFNTNSDYVPLWVAWLVGPILWYGGFIAVCYWFLRRIFLGKTESSKETEASRVERRAVSIRGARPKTDSTFQAFEFVRPGVSYSKLARIGVTMAFLIAAALNLGLV